MITSFPCKSQKCTEKRQKLENARTVKARLLRKDVERIAKREIEFAKNVMEVLFPVKISWDHEAWNRIKDFVPIRVESLDTPETEEEPTEDEE